MKLVYQAIFTPYSDGSGGFAAEFPDLPGCVTGGETLADAMFMAEDAASGWILNELESGGEIPAAGEHKDDPLEKEQFISYIALDMASYAEKFGSRSVKKTLTIPAWLNTFVEKHHISCSKVLQDALCALVYHPEFSKRAGFYKGSNGSE